VTIKGWLLVAAFVLALGFAFQGGEYSTLAWLQLRREARAEDARIAELRQEVDSLTRVAKLVETDHWTQEKIAREQHGMLKPGEHAFLIEDR